MIGSTLKLVGVSGLAFALASLSACQAGKLVNRQRTIVAVTAERDSVIQWAVNACAPTLAPFKVTRLDPKTGEVIEVDRAKWGAACARAIASLVTFKTDTLTATNGLLAEQVVKDRDAALADAESLRASNARLSTANDRLRRARANVTPDRVGPDWWGGINASAGLRDADPAAASGSGRGGGEGPTGAAVG